MLGSAAARASSCAGYGYRDNDGGRYDANHQQRYRDTDRIGLRGQHERHAQSDLSGTAAPAACGGNLTYKWTVSEGSVTNDSSPNATFDASSLNFEGGAQAQSKSVTATLTVTDPSGKTASQTTNITVKCAPTFVRLDDVIYAKNNSRVNNCGKRLLIDDAASRSKVATTT